MSLTQTNAPSPFQTQFLVCGFFFPVRGEVRFVGRAVVQIFVKQFVPRRPDRPSPLAAVSPVDKKHRRRVQNEEEQKGKEREARTQLADFPFQHRCFLIRSGYTGWCDPSG